MRALILAIFAGLGLALYVNRANAATDANTASGDQGFALPPWLYGDAGALADSLNMASTDNTDSEPPGSGGVSGDAFDTLSTIGEAGMQLVGLNTGRFASAANDPANAPYVNAAIGVENQYNIPRYVLVRLLYQESRFKPDAYNARSGATGIAQIVPRWHPDVNATDPMASISYAGKYLTQMFRQFGTWELALQAYNWGPGNLKKYLAGVAGYGSLPLETSNYSSQILADARSAGTAVA